MTASSTYADRNIRRFILFRVLFNARFYYPVFAILFLDFGLTLEQFALLNVIWAVTIVLFELPSGVLSDQLGRKRLVVAASFLMVMEMALIVFAPRGDPTLLFVLFALNRILSGMAEAAASGADEALTYDGLQAEGREATWPDVLDRMMRWQGIGFIFALILGSLLYDPSNITFLLGWTGWAEETLRNLALRSPVILTLGTAIIAFIITLRFEEPDEICPVGSGPSLRENLKQAWNAAKWIGATPLALLIVVAGFVFDSVVRLFMTLNSQYYRVIEIPEQYFGFIGAAFSALVIFIPRLSRWLAYHRGPRTIFLLNLAITLFALLGICLVLPWWGLIFVSGIYLVMVQTNFFVSHYLNALAPSKMRATILSFRGLAFNLGYAATGILFAGLIRVLEDQDTHPLGSSEMNDATFISALPWVTAYFIASLLALIVFARWLLRRSGVSLDELRKTPAPGKTLN